MSIKIYHVQRAVGYSNWITGSIPTNTIEEADLVLFEGGEDVDPSLYGENHHPETWSNIKRDEYEKVIFSKAQELGIPCLGVCRGSQFMSVMAGGKLVQHQDNPGIHLMKTIDGLEIPVSSTHHQAQYPFNLPKEDYKILGWTEGMLSFHEDGDQIELNPEVECEVVHYPKINALGIQPHPEFLWSDYYKKPKEGYDETIKWFQDLLNKFLKKEL